jgi:hypothetical protein
MGATHRISRSRMMIGQRWGYLAAALVFLSVVSGEASTAEMPTYFPGVPRIVAIGDLHGDLDATRRALKLAGAIDEGDHWEGGDLVLVQTGDQLDRGDDEQAILDLLTRLTEEAEEAGGRIHVLNGNHELMNAELDLRYVTEGGYRDFQDAMEVGEPDSVLQTYEGEQRARVVAFRPGGVYARVLAKRNLVVQIGDNVFVHGGILPHHVVYGLERLNSEVRAWLRGDAARPDSILGRESPVWTRRYSDEVDEEDCETLASVLKMLSAERMIVGHTPQEKRIQSFCDGKVWCIDVGMAAHYGGEVQVLEIRGDKLKILREE